ncbi:hypothetical protein DV451_000019 [Geotrichum candidum]|uniref:Oxysterol-binding protein n=1 Tax=Geotrichum candidum TaxID=1173061 RepID=A0A9P5KY75_GEOCN|nr:hypothetical protein DV451_000019 [Geotrichum candidum]KAI9213710.1 hypothetical protein DS838_001407 [Geotrichum bryndzae]KAF5109076.1 hypothetical protein DV453_001754 [Geotrichum candidum]KAF5115149.1 hypothetical protein DV454_002505 [Geotrichum candidum]KAF5116935.1 hypothetical protein DV495_005074 [Geotrichum candidum]
MATENKSQSGSWTSFLKSIASYNGDLASLTAPPFILSPVSLTEYSKFWAESTSEFVAPTLEQDPEQRFLKVVRWFIGTLREQYCSRNEKLGSEKKPLNPFLGEVFTGYWDNAEYGRTVLVSEQVSHHPPVTGYAIWNDDNKVQLQGYNGIKASLSTSAISVRQYGHAVLTLDSFGGEKYLITLPALHIEGILFGSPYVELEGKSFIQSTSGYKATIEYSGKGYFSGKKNTFKAKITPEGKPNDTLYTISGQWSGVSKIKDAKGKSTTFLDSKDVVVNQLQVKPTEEQSELESRRAWASVADAITQGNYELIHQEKSKLEVEQRVFRKREERDGKTWPRRWFAQTLVKDEPWYEQLSEKAGVVAGASASSSSSNAVKADRNTDTNWRFDRTLYEQNVIKADKNDTSKPDEIFNYVVELRNEDPVAGELDDDKGSLVPGTA